MKGILALAGVFTLCLLVRADENAAEMPSILKEVGIDQKLKAQVPLDVRFRDEQGQEIRLGDCTSGKPTILVLAYYRCPKLCNLVLKGLLDGLNGLRFTVGKEFNVVTLSFDASEEPELAAAKKKSYLDQYSPRSQLGPEESWRPVAEQGWRFLTGEEHAIVRLANAVGFRFRWDPFQKIFAHDSGIIFLTPEGKVSSYLFGVRYPEDQLHLALVAASQNQIGSLVDHVMLACYVYDPKVGQYTPAVMGLVRAAGALTVVVLLGFLGRRWLRDALGRPATPSAASGPSDPGALASR
jgi:protein SCO1/2